MSIKRANCPFIYPQILRGFVALYMALTLAGLPAHQSIAQEWGCYDPKPGHPTNDEKAEYVRTVSELAIQAERHHGIPAAAIAAMSIAESGYGWTRTAIEANNLFGWKYYSEQAAEGRGYFTLACQPPEDSNNRYIKFYDYQDAFLFVAHKLKTLSYYSADTENYVHDRHNQVDPVKAVNRWIEGIAEPYNWKPDFYAKTVIRFMNDPLTPSDLLNPETTLYRLSGWKPEDASSGNRLASRQEIRVQTEIFERAYTKALSLYQSGIERGGRYMEQSCAEPILNWENYPGLPVRRCTYKELNLTAIVYLLNASAEHLATWTAHACDFVKATQPEQCAKAIYDNVWGHNNAQFPVAGIVLEPASVAGGREDRAMNFVFRDGVTVQITEGLNGTERQLTDEEMERAAKADIVSVKRYARIAHITPQEYQRSGGTAEVDGVNWLKVSREAYLKAWQTGVYDLMNAWAKSNKAW